MALLQRVKDAAWLCMPKHCFCVFSVHKRTGGLLRQRHSHHPSASRWLVHGTIGLGWIGLHWTGLGWVWFRLDDIRSLDSFNNVPASAGHEGSKFLLRLRGSYTYRAAGYANYIKSRIRRPVKHMSTYNGTRVP